MRQGGVLAAYNPGSWFCEMLRPGLPPHPNLTLLLERLRHLPIKALQRRAADAVARQVIAGEYGKDAGSSRGRRGVYRTDAGVRMRRAQHEGVRLPGPGDVVEVTAVTGDEAPVLDTASYGTRSPQSMTVVSAGGALLVVSIDVILLPSIST